MASEPCLELRQNRHRQGADCNAIGIDHRGNSASGTPCEDAHTSTQERRGATTTRATRGLPQGDGSISRPEEASWGLEGRIPCNIPPRALGEEKGAAEAVLRGRVAESGAQREPVRTWQSILDGLAQDPSYRLGAPSRRDHGYRKKSTLRNVGRHQREQ